jgi:acetyltransferase-like isoleucine patch superfamily enzyme
MKFNNQRLNISKKAQIGKNVKIGDDTIIYDNVIVGDNTVISNNCVIGEPCNKYYRSKSYKNNKTIIGASSLIRSHTIIYSDSKFGENFQTGHRVTIREKTNFGHHCAVGTLSDIQGDVTFGDYCKLHSNVHIGKGSKIGDFVFIYPYVVLTNDPHPPSNLCFGVSIGDYSQIAVHSIILPGIIIGKHALIGANSTVNKNVNDFSLVAGSPAKLITDVRKIKSKENPQLFHYPWPQSFERDMPWEGFGYDEWLKNSND